MPTALRNTDLCAFLDGECDDAERERIEAALARSPTCAQRLAAWRRNDAALRVAFSTARLGKPAPIIDVEPLTIEPGGALTTEGCDPDKPAGHANSALLAALAGAGGAGSIALALFVFFGR